MAAAPVDPIVDANGLAKQIVNVFSRETFASEEDFSNLVSSVRASLFRFRSLPGWGGPTKEQIFAKQIHFYVAQRLRMQPESRHKQALIRRLQKTARAYDWADSEVNAFFTALAALIEYPSAEVNLTTTEAGFFLGTIAPKVFPGMVRQIQDFPFTHLELLSPQLQSIYRVWQGCFGATGVEQLFDRLCALGADFTKVDKTFLAGVLHFITRRKTIGAQTHDTLFDGLAYARIKRIRIDRSVQRSRSVEPDTLDDALAAAVGEADFDGDATTAPVVVAEITGSSRAPDAVTAKSLEDIATGCADPDDLPSDGLADSALGGISVSDALVAAYGVSGDGIAAAVLTLDKLWGGELSPVQRLRAGTSTELTSPTLDSLARTDTSGEAPSALALAVSSSTAISPIHVPLARPTQSAASGGAAAAVDSAACSSGVGTPLLALSDLDLESDDSDQHSISDEEIAMPK